jgi:GR25 family glycosyltransferase involved in LPS biosynthesis
MTVYRILLPAEIYPPREFEIIRSVRNAVTVKEITFETVPAADDISIDMKWHGNRFGFELSASEILNFLTHRKVWKEFLNSGEPYCMIVESNVKFSAPIDDIVCSVKEPEEDWDLFFPYDIEEKNGMTQVSGMKLLNPNLREGINSEPYPLGYKWGNSIYLASRRGAEKLLQINPVKDRLDNEIVLLSLSGQLNTLFGSADWFDMDGIDRTEWPERIGLIRDAVLKNTTWTRESREKVRSMLKTISHIGRLKKINLILQGGTHLGYVRHGEIMPWDDDVDTGIEEKCTEAFFEELKLYEEYRFGEFVEPLTNCPYYKIWKTDGEGIDGHVYRFPFVDMWMYNIKGKDIVFKNGIVCPNSAEREFEEVVFEGAPFKIPHNSIEILDTRYADWRTNIRVYSWSHRYEKHRFPLLCLPVRVDSAGRIVNREDYSIHFEILSRTVEESGME